MADEITLVLPREEEFAPVANLVLGGIAARIDLTVERLEDLELALESLLEREAPGPVTVNIEVDDSVLRACVGPFEPAALDELERDDVSFGLRRILETVCDTVELEERESGRWVQLTKATG